MKPIKSKKLRFNKETIADLHSKELSAVYGGVDYQDEESYTADDTYTGLITQCPSNDPGGPMAYCVYCHNGVD
jgi:hypothetical protein